MGATPWYDKDRRELFRLLKEAPLDVPKHVSAPAAKLLRRLLDRDPLGRLGAAAGASEIRKHQFMRPLDWDALLRREIEPPFRPSSHHDHPAVNFEPESVDMAVVTLDKEQGIADGEDPDAVPRTFPDFAVVPDGALAR